MKKKSSFQASTLRILALGACVAAGTAGCDPDAAEPDTSGAVGGVGAAGGGPGAAGGATAGGTGGSVAGGSAAGGGTTGGGAAGGGAAGGTGGANAGSVDTPWCKAKAVFDKRCISCHDGERSGGAPMALKTYADLSADSADYPGTKVFTRALARMNAAPAMAMPPGGGVPAAELQAVNAWVQAGAPAGDNLTCGGTAGGGQALAWPADCEKFYKIVAHDTADATKPYRMPAGEESHPQFVFDAPWGNEEVQALAFRPVTDNKRILHHWIVYQNSGGSAFITGWAPGQDDAERSLPDDVGMFIPSGAKSLRLDMHYYNLGADSQEELDASGVEVCVVTKAKFRPKTASVFMGFVGFGFPMVPANAVNHDLTANCNVTAREPVHLLTASPHAHKLATHMKFTARAGGKDIVMHDLPFDFEEQRARRLTEEVVLNTGDRVTTTCRYTNPTNRDVNFSENTDGEMCFNFAVYYPMGALSCGGGAGGFIGGLLGQ